MATNENLINIPGRLHSVAAEGHVAGADEIYDDTETKLQSTINSEIRTEIGTDSTSGSIKGRVKTLEDAVGTGGSVDSRISSAVNAAKSEIKGNATSACDTLGEAEALISAEASRAQATETALGSGKADKATTLAGYGITDAYTKSETYTKTEVNGLVDTPHQEYETVDAYASLPATGSKDTIYRVSNYNGSTSQVDASVYSEYAWDGSQYVFLCVKSQIDEVFDISVYNNNTKYADLASALGTDGANIPQTLRRGGMSVKYVQTSDNNYIQYFCNSLSFTTNPAYWQKQGTEYEHQDFVVRKSSTSNLLDTQNQICGVKLVPNGASLIFQSEQYSRVSHLIPVEGLSKMTFDGFVTDPTIACFLSDFPLKSINIVDWFYIREGSSVPGTRTINVPNGSKYCVVTMQGNDNATISNTDSVTTDSFVLEEVILPIVENNFTTATKKAPSNNLLGGVIKKSCNKDGILRISSTTNLLDPDSCIFGFGINPSNTPVFYKDNTKFCSHFIDCTELEKITVSGFPVGAVGVFASKPLMDASYFPSSEIYAYNIGDRVRTLDVPHDRKYFIAYYGIVGNVDISTAKVSNSASQTVDDFVLSAIDIYKELYYLSGTHNILDVSKYRTDIRITDDAPYFVQAAQGRSVMSNIFIVRGLKNITISRNQSISFSDGAPWMAFLREPSLKESSVVSVVQTYYGVSSDVTINIPDEANFAVIMLNTTRTSDTQPWQDTKISLNEIPTNEQYEQKNVGYIFGENAWYNDYSEKIKDIESVKIFERQDFEKRGIPYTIGTPNGNVLSYDNSYNRFNMLLFTDNHIDIINADASFENVVETINYLNTNRLPIHCSVNCGDFITPFSQSLASAKERAIKYFNALKKSRLAVMQAIGNHDANDWSNPPQNVLVDSDWSEMYFSWMQSKLETVHDENISSYKTPYYYKDFDAQQVRVICLNAQDIPHGANFVTSSGYCQYYGGKAWYIRQQQFDWFVNTALDFSNKENKNWGVIVFMHQDYHYGVKKYDDTEIVSPQNGALQKVFLTLKALNTQTQYTNNFVCQDESEFNLNIDADFTPYSGALQKPFVIGVFVGHEHCDKNEVYEGLNLIYTANGSATTNSSDARLSRVVGTNTQNLFDMFSIDTTHRKIYATRFGAGLNCYGVGGDRFKPNGLSF